MKTTVIVTKHNIGFYVGRKLNTEDHYGNPFSHRIYNKVPAVKVENNPTAVCSYKLWLLGLAFETVEPQRRRWIWDNMKQLKDEQLRCFGCKPYCHADVLADLVDNSDLSQSSMADRITSYLNETYNYTSGKLSIIQLIEEIKDEFEE
jgi:hypothetical protein